MAVEYTQYIDGVKISKSITSGATPNENEYKIHHR